MAAAPLGPRVPSRPVALASPFPCGVTYNTVTTFSDDTLAGYGVPTQVDSAEVCETWTGSDYQAFVQDASTAPASDVAPDLKAVRYQGGQATGYSYNGAVVADPTPVGADAFAFGQATPEEKQASYNDPYYAVYQDPDPRSCGTMVMCSVAPVTQSVDGRPLQLSRQVNPDAHLMGQKEHGVRRGALRALLANKDEIERASNGNRRFRSVRGNEESIIEIDPSTELIVAQETRQGGSRTRARLYWTRHGRGLVRDRMEVDETDDQGGQPTSRTVIEISDLRIGGSI